MKKLQKLAIYGMALCSLGMSSCAKDFSDDIDDLKNRVTSLEEKTTQINKDIKDMQDIVNAINEHEQISSVEQLSDGTGYKITFSKNGTVSRTIEIKNGTNGKDAPIIGTAKHTDGKYYWNKTVNGATEWLLDANGEKIPLTGEAAPAPTIGVDAQGYWTIDLHDGSGVKRMKDTNGKDVKATAAEGGTLGFSVSADGRYAIFTIAGKDYSFEIVAITIGFESYETVFIEQGKSVTLNIILPEGLKKDDFSAIQAKIENKNGSSQDVVTRAVPDATKWLVSLTKQTYNDNGTIKESPKVEITAPTGAAAGEAALLTIALLDNNGKTISVSRAVEIIDVTAVTYAAVSNTFTLNAATVDRPKNILINVNSSLTAAQTVVIPDTYTKANTPFIILNFTSLNSFSINDASAVALTIADTNYDGTIIIQGQGVSHEALKNEAVGGSALRITAPQATLIAKNIQITGGSDVAVSPNTFVVSSAKVGDVKMNSGSVTIEKGSTVAGNLVSTSVNPIVISGKVEGTITTSSASVELKNGAETKAIASAGIKVDSGAKVVGNVVSTGTNPVVIAGEVTGDVKASDAGKVEIGEEAKITGDLTTGGNAEVTLPPSAEIGGEIDIPVSAANISIGSTPYTTFDNAIEASKSGDIITLKAGEYTITKVIANNISLKGAGVNETTVKGEVEASGNLVVEGLHVNATSTSPARGAIHMTSPNAELTLTNAAVTQNKKGNGDGAATSGMGVYFYPNNNNSGEIKFTMTSSKINLAGGGYQHGLNIDGGDADRTAIVTITNSSIMGSVPTSSDDVYSRGIALGIVKKGSVLTMTNSQIMGVYYPINVYNSDGVTFNVNSSTIVGRCAVNLHGNDCLFNIMNSTLTGRNYYNGSSNNFAAIVVNTAKTGNIFNIDGCTITNVMTAESKQYLIDLRATENIVNFIGTQTKLIDSQKDNSLKCISRMIEVMGNSQINGLDKLLVEKSRFTALIAKMDGDGTEGNPFNIYDAIELERIGVEYTAKELEKFDLKVNYPIDAHYVQICDIDMTSVPNHKPIGKLTNHFTGAYDGGGHAIYNMAIDRIGDDNASEFDFGLFGVIGVDGVVENVNMTVNKSNPRKIIGVGSNSGDFYNFVSMGAIAGRCQGTIKNCTNEIEIVAYGSTNNNVGGIVGWVLAENNTAVIIIDNCRNSGNISKIGSVGGIVGYLSAVSGSTKISNCINTGNLEGSKGCVDGIIGQDVVNVIKENNSSTGTISENELGSFPKK